MFARFVWGSWGDVAVPGFDKQKISVLAHLLQHSNFLPHTPHSTVAVGLVLWVLRYILWARGQSILLEGGRGESGNFIWPWPVVSLKTFAIPPLRFFLWVLGSHLCLKG